MKIVNAFPEGKRAQVHPIILNSYLKIPREPAGDFALIICTEMFSLEPCTVLCIVSHRSPNVSCAPFNFDLIKLTEM